MSTTNHPVDDALRIEQFNQLYRAALETEPQQQRIEDKYIVVALGRLGQSIGTLIHSHEGWCDQDAQRITVPSHDPCSCEYCQARAAERADRDDALTHEEALDEQWRPTYEPRDIPYGYSLEVSNAVETFFTERGQLGISRSTIYRRVQTLAKRAEIDADVYPQALRATAITYWVQQGMAPILVQALMGLDLSKQVLGATHTTGHEIAEAMTDCTNRNEDLDHRSLGTVIFTDLR